MSPRWATVAGYGLYFYAEERHQRPHVDVRRGAEHATLDVITGEVLAGELPPRVLKAVRTLLSAIARKPSKHFTRLGSTASRVRLRLRRRTCND